MVNNWTECEVGYEAVTGAKWVRLFFLSFHLVGVVLVNNLVVAFIISSFLEHLTNYRERSTEEEIVGEAVIRERRAVFDASRVTGTNTSLTGAYIARLRHSNSDMSEKGERERLRQLFTHSSSRTTDLESTIAE